MQKARTHTSLQPENQYPMHMRAQWQWKGFIENICANERHSFKLAAYVWCESPADSTVTIQRCSNLRARVSRKKLHAYTVWPAWRVRVVHHLPQVNRHQNHHRISAVVISSSVQVHVIDLILAFQKRACASIVFAKMCTLYTAQQLCFVYRQTTVRIAIRIY